MTWSVFAPDPTRRETREERQQATYEAARRAAEPIEAFADWLNHIWDFSFDEVTDHDLDVMQRVTAWIETMPAEMRDGFLAHVKWERARARIRNPHYCRPPLTVLGVTFPGDDA